MRSPMIKSQESTMLDSRPVFLLCYDVFDSLLIGDDFVSLYDFHLHVSNVGITLRFPHSRRPGAFPAVVAPALTTSPQTRGRRSCINFIKPCKVANRKQTQHNIPALPAADSVLIRPSAAVVAAVRAARACDTSPRNGPLPLPRSFLACL